MTPASFPFVSLVLLKFPASVIHSVKSASLSHGAWPGIHPDPEAAPRRMTRVDVDPGQRVNVATSLAALKPGTLRIFVLAETNKLAL